MSRIGIKPVIVPAGVEASVDANNVVTVKGPKGTIVKQMPEGMEIKVESGVITVSRPNDLKKMKSFHGLTRTLINNMVIGVSEGYQKKLEINGVGYRAQMQGNKLIVNAGYSHPVEVDPMEGIEIECPTNTKIVVKGINKEKVGATAANIRAIRTPEPYKGKGIRYEGEYVRQKEGKTAK